MGASWRRGSAAALLLVLAAALLPPPAAAGSAADPEVSDPAGDQAVDEGSVPVVPGVNDGDFGDVDLLAAFVTEFGNLTRITVQTTSGWTTGSMTVTFTVSAGPTSLASSTASGAAFTVFVNGTTVAGVAGTAAATTDGLRIDLATSSLGAVGGDLLAGLNVTTTRTDPGALQGVPQDDQTGSDAAGPGRDYMFSRPPVSPKLDLSVVSVGGVAGGSPPERADTGPFDVVVRATNLGADPDRVVVGLSWDADGADGGSQALAVDMASATSGDLVQPGASLDRTFTVTPPGLDGLHAMALSILAMSERGAQDSAQVEVRFHVEDAPPAAREVKPAGLAFLSSGAEAMGLDDAFGSYGEAFLLALIVLLTILAIFLLLALGRSTTKGEPAPEAPWPAGADATPTAFAGPGGLAETVHASPARSSAAAVPADAAQTADGEEGRADFGALMAAAQELAGPAEASAEEAEPLDFTPAPAAGLPTAAAGARIRIEEVRHTPREPEAGQGVTTEVILRNDGPSATLRIALSVDGKQAAERTVQVPSRATKAVELPWTAGAGDNRVRIQAFPA